MGDTVCCTLAFIAAFFALMRAFCSRTCRWIRQFCWMISAAWFISNRIVSTRRDAAHRRTTACVKTARQPHASRE